MMTHLRLPILLPSICLAAATMLAGMPGRKPEPPSATARIPRALPSPLGSRVQHTATVSPDKPAADPPSAAPDPIVRLPDGKNSPHITVDSLIDFGGVPIGSYRDTTILAVNEDTVPIPFDRVSPLGVGDTEFQLVRVVIPPGSGTDILPGKSVAIQLRFQPTGPGERTGAIEMVYDNRRQQTIIKLQGRAMAPVLRIDSATIAPGEIATLRVWLDNVTATTISSYSIQLGVDIQGLFLQQVISDIDGTEAEWHFADGRWLITCQTGGHPMVDGRLCRLRLLGLSTGQAVNRVTVDAVALAELGPVSAPVTGLVRLRGCDVDLSLMPVGKLAIDGCAASGAGSAIAVTYTAPPGSAPIARLFDMMGHLISEQQAPAQPSIAGLVEIPIATLPRGLYLLDLVDRGVHTSTLIPVPVIGR